MTYDNNYDTTQKTKTPCLTRGDHVEFIKKMHRSLFLTTKQVIYGTSTWFPSPCSKMEQNIPNSWNHLHSKLEYLGTQTHTCEITTYIKKPMYDLTQHTPRHEHTPVYATFFLKANFNSERVRHWLAFVISYIFILLQYYGHGYARAVSMPCSRAHLFQNPWPRHNHSLRWRRLAALVVQQKKKATPSVTGHFLQPLA